MANRHLQQLYDDACDVGFSVKSEKGNEVVFHMTEVKKDADGDILSWEYQLTDESERKFPECGKMTATIFND